MGVGWGSLVTSLYAKKYCFVGMNPLVHVKLFVSENIMYKEKNILDVVIHCD